MTASEIAYTILVYINTKEAWEEDLQIKASSRTDEERCNTMHHKNKYHLGRGIHLKRFGMARQTMAESITKIAQDF